MTTALAPRRPPVLLALGPADSALTADGPDRFAEMKRLAERHFARRPPAPRLAGAFAFDHASPWPGFPAAWFVPAAGPTAATGPTAGKNLQVSRQIIQLPNSPGQARPAHISPCPADLRAWRALVATARAAIAAGALEKVVVARALEVRRPRPVDPLAFARALARAEPRALAFALAPAGPDGPAFVGATPERLVRRRGLLVETGALAGSAPRGATEADDRALGRALLESEKDAREHEIVVRSIRERLGPLAAHLRCGRRRLLRLSRVQHLHTPIEAVLVRPIHVLDLVALLHPTPATAGAPREAALDFLRRHEGLARGWYAGAVGWLDAAGDGDFRVAIRSARVAAATVTLHAGAGIVAGSDADLEWAETAVKLRRTLEVLESLDRTGDAA